MRYLLPNWQGLLLFCCLSALLSPLFAQKYITGSVLDAETSRRVPGATILINGYATTASSGGNFFFELDEVFGRARPQFEVLVMKEGFEILIQQVDANVDDDELRIAAPLTLRPARSEHLIGVMIDDSTGQMISEIRVLISTKSGTPLYEGVMDQYVSIPIDETLRENRELTVRLFHPLYHSEQMDLSRAVDGYELGVVSMRQSFKQAAGEVRVRVQPSEEQLDIVVDGLDNKEDIRLQLYQKGNLLDQVDITNNGYMGSEDYVWTLPSDKKWRGKDFQIRVDGPNAFSDPFAIGKGSISFPKRPVLFGAGALVVGGVVYLLLRRRLPAFPSSIDDE